MTDNTEKTDIVTRPSLKSWKLWFLIYPSFAIAALGAIPQYINVIKGFSMGVDASQVSYAEIQNNLWVKNQNCNPTLSTVTTNANSHVSVGACPTGDIQINITFPDNSRIVRWFGFDELKKTGSSNNDVFKGFGVNPAVAEQLIPSKIQLASSDDKIICQKLLKNGKMVRIINTGDTCYKETINTYTGKVEEYIEVECSSSC